jgi:hypothetical protein
MATRTVALVLIAFLGASASGCTGRRSEVPVAEGSCGWVTERSLNPGNVSNELNGVSGTAAVDVWAVGTTVRLRPGETPQAPPPAGAISGGPARQVGIARPLALHWNGEAWLQVDMPAPEQPHPNPLNPVDPTMRGVLALARADAWAYGYGQGLGDQPFFEHWDGHAWMVVPGPSAAGQLEINALGGSSSNDVWAVGSLDLAGVSHTYSAHWDGVRWTVVPSPNLGPHDNHLNGVGVVSPHDAWAVGQAWERPIVLHWDGVAWRAVSIPTDGRADRLFGVAALSSKDAWTVGTSFADVDGRAPARAIFLHWDGTRWQLVPGADLAGNQSDVLRIAAVSSREVWVLGARFTDAHGAVYSTPSTLVERWDGHRWSVAPAPSPPPALDRYKGFAAIPGNDVWVAGTRDHAGRAIGDTPVLTVTAHTCQRADH